jgi:hypothetical protein
MASDPKPDTPPTPVEPPLPPNVPPPPDVELGGRKGPEPTRYGDWEKGGIAVDF